MDDKPTQTTTGAATDTTPPESPQFTAADVQDADGKRWKDKFFGLQGRVSQVEAERMTIEQQMKAQLGTIQTESSGKDATIAELKVKLAGLGRIPELEAKIKELEAEANKAAKYRVAMRYPTLLALETIEEIPDPDGGEPKRIKTNPVLDLIESSGLDSVALEMTLQRMAAALPSQRPTQPQTTVGPASPAPAEPAGDDKEAWIARAKDAQRRINQGEFEAMAEFNEATHKINEIEITEASN
jgi:hypothetical protein